MMSNQLVSSGDAGEMVTNGGGDVPVGGSQHNKGNRTHSRRESYMYL